MKKDENYFHKKGKAAENILHKLAEKTFLGDWSYKNPEVDNNKELCDLLVVYDNIAIIWQIKNLKLNKKGLYKKSEVEKNLRQLSGAKRRLFGIKKPLRLKNPRRGVEMFDPTLINKIFLISVLFGQGEEVFSFIEEVKNHKIHIFDEEFTKIILKELDTITDFIDYLIKKEALISPGKSFL